MPKVTSPEAKTEWVLLRGLGREAGHWGEFPGLLAQGSPGASILAVDLPGAGEFHREKSPLTIAGITDHVRRTWLERHDCERQSHLVAISLGAMVAADWLARHPEDFRSGTLINTSFGGLSPFYRRLTPRALAHFVNISLARDGEERERRVLAMVSNRAELQARVAREWAAIAEQRPVSIETFLRQLLAASRFSVPQIPHPPILLLGSQADRMVEHSCTLALARRWALEVEVHPSAGHELTLDAAPWVCERIHRFRQKVFNISGPSGNADGV